MKFISKKGWSSIVPLHLRSETANFCLLSTRRGSDYSPGNIPVYLNVYDLTPVNGCVYWAGVGIFHSGVEVNGIEYAFGSLDCPTSGIFEVEPRQYPGFTFRKSIFMGTTSLDPVQVSDFIEYHSEKYRGDTYHFIVKNCNHFSEDICYKLTGKNIPKWVNRLARIGSHCKCMLPKVPATLAICHGLDFRSHEREKKRRWSSSSSISLHGKKISMSSLFQHSHYKGCLPPWELNNDRKTVNPAIKVAFPFH